MCAWGVDAVLVGEALVKSPDIGAHVRELAGVPRSAPGGNKPIIAELELRYRDLRAVAGLSLTIYARAAAASFTRA